MNRSTVLALAVGLGLGVGITLVVFNTKRPAAPVATTKPNSPEPVQEVQPTAATAEAAPPAPVKVESTPAPTSKPAFDFKTSFAELTKKGLSAYGSVEMSKLAVSVKESGKDGLRLVTDQLQNSSSPQDRFLAAALLEKIGDPGALPVLAATLKNDPDLLVRRMTSHAVAFIGTDEAADILRPAMLNDEDWGVRVNSAYGLAKLKQPDGLETLQRFYASADTPAEYRLAILGGLADVAAPATGPLFRQVLADTTDVGYILVAIGALEKMKDTQALPDLQRISTSAKSDMIRQAAQRAIDSINK